eukprot:RCo023836
MMSIRIALNTNAAASISASASSPFPASTTSVIPICCSFSWITRRFIGTSSTTSTFAEVKAAGTTAGMELTRVDVCADTPRSHIALSPWCSLGSVSGSLTEGDGTSHPLTFTGLTKSARNRTVSWAFCTADRISSASEGLLGRNTITMLVDVEEWSGKSCGMCCTLSAASKPTFSTWSISHVACRLNPNESITTTRGCQPSTIRRLAGRTSMLERSSSGASGQKHGTVAVNRHPWPSPPLLTRSVPCIRCISRCEITRPRPVPPYRRVIELSAWLKGWNSRPIAASLSPIPVSSTSTVHHSRR